MPFEGLHVDFLTIREAAERLHVSPNTITSWIHRGHLQVIDLKQFGGHGKVISAPALTEAEREVRSRDRTGKARRRTA